MAFSIVGTSIKTGGEFIGEGASHSEAVRIAKNAVASAQREGQSSTGIQERAVEIIRQSLGQSPSVCFGAIVEVQSRLPEGEVVKLLDPFYSELVLRLIQNPDTFQEIGPRMLEEIVAASYDRAGFDEVILTPRSGDQGRDVIAIKRGFGSVRILEEVKAYSPSHRVTAKEVRALLGVLLSDQKASKGFLTTTSSFAPRIAEEVLIQQHIPGRLELVDREGLLDRLEKIAGA